MSKLEVFDPGTISSREFAWLFESVEVGTAFHVMGGTVPGPGDDTTIEVSSYNYAQGKDLFPAFGEAHLMHGEYSFELPRAEVVISAGKNARYAKDNEHLEFRAMRVILQAGRPISASLVALGGWEVDNDFWLVRDNWLLAAPKSEEPKSPSLVARFFSRG